MSFTGSLDHNVICPTINRQCLANTGRLLCSVKSISAPFCHVICHIDRSLCSDRKCPLMNRREEMIVCLLLGWHVKERDLLRVCSIDFSECHLHTRSIRRDERRKMMAKVGLVRGRASK